MKRGDVWSAATGSGFGSKPRPVVVVQADAYGNAPSIIVALLTSTGENVRNVRPRIEPDGVNNLHEPSLVMVDILVTVPRLKFGQQIGRLTGPDQDRVDQALLTYLGFAG